MQKVFKKVLVLILALTFVLSTCVIAQAEAPVSVTRKSIAKAKVTLSPASSIYNKEKQKANVVVELDGKVLTEGKDYTVKGNKTSKAKSNKYKLSVTVTGIGRYKGTVKKTLYFTIKKVPQTITLATTELEIPRSEVKSKSKYYDLGVEGLLNYRLSWTLKADIKGYKSGKIKIPKGIKKGTYTIYVKAGSSTNYASSAKVKVVIHIV